ncbi:MAG: DUF4785 domain-containing protein [Massilia sp.]
MHTTFQTHIVRAFLLASAALLADLANAAPHFLPSQQGDLVPSKVSAPEVALKSPGAPAMAREAVTMSWAATDAVSTAVQPFIGQSREYYMEVSADDLHAGVAIHTTSPRALVRMQPLNGGETDSMAPRAQLAIHPQSLVIVDAAGRAFDAGNGMDMLVTADKLNKADMPFAEGTSAFRIHPDLGTGRFTLRAADIAGSARYLVNVVEPASPLVMALRTDAPTYLHGQTLTVQSELQEQIGARIVDRHALKSMSGVVVSPGGRSFPVSFKVDKDGQLRARLPLDANEAPAPGLWEVQASGEAVVKGQTVKRSLRVAFGVALPVARFDGNAAMVSEPGSVSLRIGVEVGAAGRYETRALLFGTVDGVLKPLAVAHAAQWLEAGSQSLVLRYDAALLNGATGPYELRDLTLLDQGRMGVLQRQQRGIGIADSDVVRSGAHAALAKPAERPKLPPQNG